MAHTPIGPTPRGVSDGTPGALAPSPHAQLLQASPAANNVAATPLVAHAAELGRQHVEAMDGEDGALLTTPQPYAAWLAAQEGVLASQAADDALLLASQATDDDALLHALAQAAASQPLGGISRCHLPSTTPVAMTRHACVHACLWLACC